jgi:hypothetical protein
MKEPPFLDKVRLLPWIARRCDGRPTPSTRDEISQVLTTYAWSSKVIVRFAATSKLALS